MTTYWILNTYPLTTLNGAIVYEQGLVPSYRLSLERRRCNFICDCPGTLKKTAIVNQKRRPNRAASPAGAVSLLPVRPVQLREVRRPVEEGAAVDERQQPVALAEDDPDPSAGLDMLHVGLHHLDAAS